MADQTQKQLVSAASARLIRAVVAMAVPVLLSYLVGHPDVRLAGLAPLLMALGKYLRDAFGMDWIPV